MQFSEDKINVFISYSWDGKEHQEWVLQLANEINRVGGNSLIDQRDLRFGANMPLFMETMIIRADVVLLILTPNYKDKADHRLGGVGYEYNIINNKLYQLHENEKYIPVLREGDVSSAVPIFLQTYRYADLRGEDYEDELTALLSQILGAPMKRPDKQKSKQVDTKIEYLSENKVNEELSKSFEGYFRKVFNLPEASEFISAGGSIIKTDIKRQIKSIRSHIESWEKKIDQDSLELQNAFAADKMSFFEDYPNEFKSKVFKNKLWTVSSAMKTSDPDLARYKKDFADVAAEDVLETVRHILECTQAYVSDTASNLNYSGVKVITDLKMEFLDEDDMFLNKIIGFGVRSEILHRIYPAHFSIMTQRSLWGIYFLTDRAREFIAIEHKSRSGVMRVSHNWQYDYARFNYYANYLFNLIQDHLEAYKVKLKPQFRFGYVNLFLQEVAAIHKEDIKVLHDWSDI